MFSNRIFILLYWLIALIYLWADANAMQWLVYSMKPALVTTLLIYYISSVQPKFNSFSISIIAGLIFSIAGDTFLLFNEYGYFRLGLGCFLLTHVFYANAFFGAAPSSLTHSFASRKNSLVFFIVLLIMLMTYLWSDVGALRWPVLVYGTAIAVMGFSAFNLKGTVSENVFLLLSIGALLFFFSDTIIALDKFKASQLNLPFPAFINHDSLYSCTIYDC